MKPLSAEAYLAGIREGNRVLLSQAITLVESTLDSHRSLAQEIVNGCLSLSGNSFRTGITGAPGVGKSTFIDALGISLIEEGKKVAVLAIDPSSEKTSGSILGDKTRMARLSRHKNAFIRPSPSSGTLGGIASRTREVIVLCEAAGFDLIFVETVGVGQSEFRVHQLVDMLLLLIITGAGDDLQGIKRGIMEMADAIIINKADDNNVQPARQLKRMIRQAVHVLPDPREGWQTQVFDVSSSNDSGFAEVASLMAEFKSKMQDSNAFEANRANQSLSWMRRHIEEGLLRRLKEDKRLSQAIKDLEKQVIAGTKNPVEAAETILNML